MESISIQARGRLSGGGGEGLSAEVYGIMIYYNSTPPPPPEKKKAQVSVFQYLIEI